MFPSAQSRLDCCTLDTPLMRNVLSLPLLALFAACSSGGKETTPASEVKIAASHHLFSFRALAGFGTFPINPSTVITSKSALNLFDDSTYTLATSTGTSGADRYAIATGGAMSIYVTGSGREPSVVFQGAYAQDGGASVIPNLFFTDRVSTPNSQTIGLYLGTRVVPGQVELEGAWHVVSLHTIFNEAILSPDNVARAVQGAVSISAGAAGTQRTISGTGQQTSSVITFGGTIQNLLSNNTGDGTCNLTLSYQATGQAADSRVCYCAATNNLILGLDSDETDGEAGLVVMLRKFDAPATPADPTRIAGTYLVGGETMFVNPSNPGSDAFVGTVTLASGGGFRLDAAGNDGADFAYTGSYTTNADGHLTITIAGTNETWFGAVDRDYQTLIFLDDFRELRSNNQPELNLGFGVRKKV